VVVVVVVELVVVVVVVIVVVVVVTTGHVGPSPGTGHASQQLAHVPAVPPNASHLAALRIGLHFGRPSRPVRQQVTNPDRPQIERRAQRFTYLRQPRFARTASSCTTAQRT
jgi:hypothetical protein